MTGIVADDALALDATAKLDFLARVVDDFVRKNFELLSSFIQLHG